MMVEKLKFATALQFQNPESLKTVMLKFPMRQLFVGQEQSTQNIKIDSTIKSLNQLN